MFQDLVSPLKWKCTNCEEEIIANLGVECVECHNEKRNFRFCFECFSSGAEIGQHRNHHKYRVFDSGSLVLNLNPTPKSSATSTKKSPGPPASTSTAIEGTKWSARDEIRLLSAIEQYGFGNWEDISKHVESKNAAEVKTHYVNTFVNGLLGQLTWPTGAPNCNDVVRNTSTTELPKDHTVNDDEEPLWPTSKCLPPLEISSDHMEYMPNWDDYEEGYDHSEDVVSRLAFDPDDSELNTRMKLNLVDNYTFRLRLHTRRKLTMRYQELAANFFEKEKAKKRGSLGQSSGSDGQFVEYEKTLLDKLRPFAQFLNKEDHENLIYHLVREEKLKYRMSEVCKYRS